MATLYVDRNGSVLRLEDGRLVMETGPARFHLPLLLLDRLIIQADALLSARLLIRLVHQATPVILTAARRPDQFAVVCGSGTADAFRRLQQYRHFTNEAWRNAFARRLVREKLKQQRLFLLAAAQQRAECRAELRKAAARIREAEQFLLDNGELTRDQLLGMEGASAAAYFAAYARLFAPSLQFEGRNRRPPRDPVNACLSLGYTLVYAGMLSRLVQSGLDPYLGYLHELAHGRASLAADLLELLRPVVDDWVWRLFRARRLRPEHFSLRDQQCLLGKAGRKSFYEGFEELRPALNRRQRRLCYWLVRLLTGVSDSQPAFSTSNEEFNDETPLSGSTPPDGN